MLPMDRQNTLSVVFFTLVAIVVLWAVGMVLAPFITPILLAAIVVTFTFPFYRRLKARLKGRDTLAAVLMLLVVTFVIILPAFLLMMLLIQQATDLFRLIQVTDVPAMFDRLQIQQRLAPLARIIPGFDPKTIQVETMVVGVVKQIPGLVATHGRFVLAGLVNIVLGFILMLLAAFYFYVDGERLVRELRVLSPLPDEYDSAIFSRFSAVVDATFRGQMLTALAQGAVTALGLWIAHVPGAIFWGAVAAVFSLIPMVGAGAIWVSATIYLILTAAYHDTGYGYAIFLALWGIFVVSLVDNLIRPWAMRSGTRMPAVLLFFSILGGIQAFGFVGLILGPLMFALVVPLVDIYKTILLQRERAAPSPVPAPAPAAQPPPLPVSRASNPPPV
jgi:predicted PurR-regulated permease PerM